MKASYFFTLGIGLCLFLTACVTTSVNPLSSPDDAKPDPRLTGDWRGHKNPNNTFRFTPTKGAWMHVEIIPDKPGDEKESYDVFPTIIGANSYLNVEMTDKDSDGNPTKSYVFVRYTLSGDNKLQMWMISQDAAAEAVRSGKIKGTVHQDKNALLVGKPPHPDVDVILKGSSANLFKFIQTADVDKLFANKMETLYHVKATGK